MTREIKFRAWDKRFNLMLYPDNFYNEYISADGKVIEIEEWSDYSGGGFHTNDVSQDYILMQYTGLKDKNGKEIYEGDVIETEKMEYSDSGHYIGTVKVLGKVVFNNGRYALHLETGAMPDLSFALSFHEIIGNKYENPELLQEEWEERA